VPELRVMLGVYFLECEALTCVCLTNRTAKRRIDALRANGGNRTLPCDDGFHLAVRASPRVSHPTLSPFGDDTIAKPCYSLVSNRGCSRAWYSPVPRLIPAQLLRLGSEAAPAAKLRVMRVAKVLIRVGPSHDAPSPM